MVIDFGILKSVIGDWIDEHWDHTGIFWNEDNHPAVNALKEANSSLGRPLYTLSRQPTAENIAYELGVVATSLLEPYSIVIKSVQVLETPNCSATWYSF